VKIVKVMLTGGTGFIGSWTAKALLEAGHEVTLFARNPEKVRGFQGRVGMRFVQGALADTGKLQDAVVGQDVCIHIALGWGDTASEMMRADTLPSVELFQAAIDAGVEKVIFTSSIAVFGDRRATYTDDTAVRPDRYYGATKAAAEAYLLAAAGETTVRGNVIRPGYTFGEPAVDGGTIYTDTKLGDIVGAALRGEAVTVRQNDGTQFIWVGDLARLYVAIAHSDVSRQLYSAVSANFTTWEQIARMAIEETNSSSELIIEPTDLDPTRGRNDVSAIRDAFGMEFDSTNHLRAHVKYLAGRILNGA
jgi:UDP-glucose 4-epimerase